MKLTDEELRETEILSERIDQDSLNIKDYLRYEELLLKSGFKKEEVRESLYKYGFLSYEEYIEAKKTAKTREEKRIVNVKIVAALVVFFLVLLFTMPKKKKNINR